VNSVALLVIAKEPVPGRVKTRLTPPLPAVDAADLAGAALEDTLDVVTRTRARRRVLVFDGDATAWRRSGWEVIPQRGEHLGERLAAAFADVGEPAVLVGMDTPQLTEPLLTDAARTRAGGDADAVLGRARDGGYWLIGFGRSGAHGAFAGVPMSDPRTWCRQRARLRALGMTVREQPPLRDVDTIADARAVARLAPRSRFAATLWALAA
jgi:uncharacterized protein